MKRGDIVAISAQGDFGKPRPALIIQADWFSDLPSVTVLPLTSDLRPVPLVRVEVEPDAHNRLIKKSHVMVDKATTVKREKIGAKIGAVDPDILVEIDRLLALFLGIAK